MGSKSSGIKFKVKEKCRFRSQKQSIEIPEQNSETMILKNFQRGFEKRSGTRFESFEGAFDVPEPNF